MVSKAKSKVLVNVLGRLIVAAAVYFVWQERNDRIFRNHTRPPDALCDIILATIRYKMMGLKLKKIARVMAILGEWKIGTHNMFDDGGRWSRMLVGCYCLLIWLL